MDSPKIISKIFDNSLKKHFPNSFSSLSSFSKKNTQVKLRVKASPIENQEFWYKSATQLQLPKHIFKEIASLRGRLVIRLLLNPKVVGSIHARGKHFRKFICSRNGVSFETNCVHPSRPSSKKITRWLSLVEPWMAWFLFCNLGTNAFSNE